MGAARRNRARRRGVHRPLQRATVYGTAYKRYGENGLVLTRVQIEQRRQIGSWRRSSAVAHGRSRERSRCSGPPSLLISQEGAQMNYKREPEISGARGSWTASNCSESDSPATMVSGTIPAMA